MEPATPKQPGVDKYDAEIAFLRENPKKILENWEAPSPLFRHISLESGDQSCGCITEIMFCGMTAWDQRVTKEILNRGLEYGIPNIGMLIRRAGSWEALSKPTQTKILDALPRIAELQRRVKVQRKRHFANSKPLKSSVY